MTILLIKGKYYYTSEIADAVGVHPNTVRLYETWEFLPTIPRSASGYRLFKEAHLDQMRLARTALEGPWPGTSIKEAAVAMVRQAAAGDLGGALPVGLVTRSGRVTWSISAGANGWDGKRGLRRSGADGTQREIRRS